jgi:hypothetical protein
MKSKPSHLVIHEQQPNGQHRIIVHNGGTPAVGAWAEHHQLAVNGPFLASNGGGDANLPLGVFTVRGVAHQTLA